MKLNTFELEINPLIIERGQGYFKRKRAKITEQDHNTFFMLVNGTEDYHVIVELSEQGTILSSTCDCPYDKGPVCKHQVAAFYTIRECWEPSLTLPSLLNDLSKEELIAIILRHANEDNLFEDRLFIQFAPDNETDNFKPRIEETIDIYADSSGFVSYYEMPDLVEGLSLILTAIQTIKDVETSLEAALYLLTKSIKLLGNSDDSSGELGYLIDEIYACITEIALDEPYDSLQIFHLIHQAAKAKYLSEWWNYRIDLLNIALIFKELPEARQLLAQTIELYLGSPDLSDYYKEDLMKIKYKLLPVSEQLPFLKRNLQYDGLRELLVEELMNKQGYQEVIDVALEGEKLHQNTYPGRVNQWKQKRFAAYEALGRVAEQRRLAEELLLAGNFDYYLKLKQLPGFDYPDILKKTENRVYLNIIDYEKDLPRLMAFVQKYTGYIGDYVHLLGKVYPDEVAEIYQRRIISEASIADSRPRYREICQLIRKYQQFAEPNEAAGLISELQATYKRRPAFMDELSKI